MKLTNEEMMKVFALYWGCKIWDVQGPEGEEVIEAACLTSDNIIWDKDGNDIKVKELKLILSSLSAVSDEDAIEVANIANCLPVGWERNNVIRTSDYPNNGKEISTCNNHYIFRMTERCEFYLYDNVAKTIIYTGNNYGCYQYLISKSYAVPLFFGTNHWATGKTAIELGIAIEKPKEDIDNEPPLCEWCSGTGEGASPDSRCNACKGSGVKIIKGERED